MFLSRNDVVANRVQCMCAAGLCPVNKEEKTRKKGNNMTESELNTTVNK